nr:MAG TPA: YjcQ protein [Caudoviricetes sp.]
MDNFKIIYRILKTLEQAMDYEIFDNEIISHDKFGISYERWKNLMIQLNDNGYISGVHVIRAMGGSGIKLIDPKITLKGMEYLEDNTMMKKAYKLLKGAKDLLT